MIVNFYDVESCEVDLIQNEAVEQWCDLQIENAKRVPYWTRQNSTAFHTGAAANPTVFHEAYTKSPDTINRRIDELEQLTGVRWPVRAFQGMSFETCNLLHRMFTTSLASRRGWNITPEALDAIFAKKQKSGPLESYWPYHLGDDDYNIPRVYPFVEWNTPEWDRLVEVLESINAIIHRYEDLCLVSERSKRIAKQFPFSNELIDVEWDIRNHEGMILRPIEEIDPIWANKNLPNYYDVDPEYDVYQCKNILGKSYMLAYQQYEDPRHWDVTRTSQIDGSFTLDPHNNTGRFYNSPEFKSWLDDYGHPFNPGLFGHLQIGKMDPAWKEQLMQTTLETDYKTFADCKTEWMSESNKVCDPYQVTSVEFYE